MQRSLPTALFAAGLLALVFLAPARAQQPFIYSSTQAEKVIAPQARGVITALRDRHMDRLAGFVHPSKGLQFSPYAHASASDRRFSRAQVRNLGKNQQRFHWGSFDGTGDPIRLSWREYFHQFVYTRDFAAVGEINYNVVRQRGNTLHNLRDAYPGSIVVEYFSPDAKEADGMDWQSLWLVFQPRGTTWYLVGIAHDRWTI